MANLLQYFLQNPIGNNAAGTMNVLPAALSTLSNLWSLQSSKTSYDLYREQAQSYLTAARENADLIKKQGEIALRNLHYKNKLMRGTEIVNVGARGGNLSGSTLDVLVQQEKIRQMDEATVQANYTNKAMMEMYHGYQQAASAYGALAAKAGMDKYSAIASLFKGVETYIGLQVRDGKVASALQAQKELVDYSRDSKEAFQNEYFLVPEKPVINEGKVYKEIDASLDLNNSILNGSLEDSLFPTSAGQTEIKFY